MRLHSAQSIPIRKRNFVAYKQGRIGDYYEDLSEIGVGAYGTVSKGKNMVTSIYRAIKSVKKAFYSQNETERIIEEHDTLKHINHPNIIQLYEIIEDPRAIHLVSELYTGGELLDRILE
jgi:serine/threonine protein kinase